MLNVERKKKRPHKHVRLFTLLFALVLLGGSVGLYYYLSQTSTEEVPENVNTGGTVASYEDTEVQHVQITLRSGESWGMTLQDDGTYLMDGEDWTVDSDAADDLLLVTATISYEDVLTEDPTEYQDDLSEFGLDNPTVIASVTYTDGNAVTLRVGDASGDTDESWYYMTIDGDDRLLTIASGTVTELSREKALMHSVTQPTLHKARMDDITFADGNGNTILHWTLQGEITDSDASSSWQMVYPYTYPTDEESMTNLRTNLSNLHLGAFVGEATEENLTTYGFDEPRFILTIHQAAGTTNTTDDDGAVTQTDWPESTFTLTVGGEKNDNVDYVLVDGNIYITSHFTLNVFMSAETLGTISRYPVLTAVGNLQSLTIADENGETVYTITREARVTENNELETDSDGNTVYDVTCTQNGTEISYDTFEAAYLRMETAKVTGKLPDGWSSTEDARVTMTFVSSQGQTHVIRLIPYDALHDAVELDGCSLFYIIQDGLTLDMGSSD
jgi:hypothetical protein